MQFADFNMVATIGAFGFGLSQLIFLWMVLKCIKGGAKARANYFDAQDDGLEWTVPSPAPFHTFETPPKLDWKHVH
jgi:cytochrome c oxidase subunit 1